MLRSFNFIFFFLRNVPKPYYIPHELLCVLWEKGLNSKTKSGAMLVFRVTASSGPRTFLHRGRMSPQGSHFQIKAGLWLMWLISLWLAPLGL